MPSKLAYDRALRELDEVRRRQALPGPASPAVLRAVEADICREIGRMFDYRYRPRARPPVVYAAMHCAAS